MPTFGADAGPGNDYSWVTSNWTMDIRQDNMKDDRLSIIRHPEGGVRLYARYNSDDGAYLAKCGWQASPGNLWGAIWRYRHHDIYSDFSEANRNFVVDGDYSSYYANRYKFSISDGSATFQSVGTPIGGTYSSEHTTWVIPGVDENPTFLYFDY